MADPVHAWRHRNGSTTAATYTVKSVSQGNGIIPGTIAAGLFIAFLLALYAVLWRCMVTPPKRKRRKRCLRERQKTPV